MRSKINAQAAKKIATSVFVISAVILIASGSTMAFFSDMEKSKGNIFTAGQLDLKVDSKSYYNGLVCTEDQQGSWYWANPDPVICKGMSKDQVTSSDFIGTKTANSKKVGSIDNECQNYGFDFGIAKWEWNTEDNIYVAEDDTSGTLLTGDDELAEWISSTTVAGVLRKAARDYDVLSGGLSGEVLEDCVEDNMPKPCRAISHITFCGNDQGPNCGNCIIEKGEECDGGIFCTSDCKLIKKETCVGTWRETDLQEGVHKFFNFYNIKPGDTGEDAISLHVYDNDAWGRLVINDISDNENGCVDSAETDAEPNCVDDGLGELRENMTFKFWLDQGSIPGFQNTVDALGDLKCPTCDYDPEEGDNIRQADSEPLLSAPRAISLTGETWNLEKLLKNAYINYCLDESGDRNTQSCEGLTSDGRMMADYTYYFGLGWDLPLGASSEVNKMQSDSFSGDMVFEVEQHRHNDNSFEN